MSITKGEWWFDGKEIIAMPGQVKVAGYVDGATPEERQINAQAIAAIPEMWDVIEDFGTAVTDMFEQLTRGHWVDADGHKVVQNKQMDNLKKPVLDAIKLRAKILQLPKENSR